MGETKRTLKVRLSEYRQAVRQGEPKNGLQFMFRSQTIASTAWDGATVQRRAKVFWQRRTVEAIQTGNSTPNMSLNSGLLLPVVWNSILNPPHTPPTYPPLLLLYSYFSLCLVNSMSIIHDYHFYVFYC